MSTLTTNNDDVQLKAIPVPGYIAFRYFRKVNGQWLPCNPGEAKRASVAFNAKG